MIRCKICNYIHEIDDYTINCPLCKAQQWEDYYIGALKEVNDDQSFIDAMMSLKESDPIEFQIKLKQLDILSPSAFLAESKRKQEEEEKLVTSQHSYGQPHCPKCYSTAIATTNRGFSLVTGFIGSGSPRNVCQNCGHKWKP